MKKDKEVKKATQFIKDGKKWLKETGIWLKEKDDEREKMQQNVYKTELRRIAEEEYIYAQKSKYPQQFPNLDQDSVYGVILCIMQEFVYVVVVWFLYYFGFYHIIYKIILE